MDPFENYFELMEFLINKMLTRTCCALRQVGGHVDWFRRSRKSFRLDLRYVYN